MERKLHIGGHERRDGWEILDANPGPLVDHVGNANDLSRFADGTFAEIYASHVLEHFDYKDALAQVLVEWRRVLTPAGVLRISVPDIDVLAHLLLQKQALDVSQRYQIMRMMFGGHIDAYDYHLVGLNEEFLVSFLAAAGFERVQRVLGHGLFTDTSDMDVGGVRISLNLNAFKGPAAPGQGG